MSALATDPYSAWHRALSELTGDQEQFASWRRRRYAFAHRIGRLLTEAHLPTPAASGPALYGVYLAGTGLCYVGQTQDARRRLRDLPVGESHHLAVTVPPELWARVIVIHWTELLAGAPGDSEGAMADTNACGKVLEYLLHRQYHPLINCYSRTSDGSYRERPPERSRSRAAASASQFSELFKAVLDGWSELEAVPDTRADGFGVSSYTPYGRVIFPAALLADGAASAAVPEQVGC